MMPKFWASNEAIKPKNCKEIKKIVWNNHKMIVSDIADIVRISIGYVPHILHEFLGMPFGYNVQ